MKNKVVLSILALFISAFFIFKVMNFDFGVNKAPANLSIIKLLENKGLPDDIKLKRLDGMDFSFESLPNNKIYLVNFWASWCEPCAKEFPSLIKLVENFEGKIVLIAVSSDEDLKDVKNFLNVFNIQNPNVEILIDSDKTAANFFGVNKLPESFIFDYNKKLVRKIVGVEDWFTKGSIGYFTELSK